MNYKTLIKKDTKQFVLLNIDLKKHSELPTTNIPELWHHRYTKSLLKKDFTDRKINWDLYSLAKVELNVKS